MTEGTAKESNELSDAVYAFAGDDSLHEECGVFGISDPEGNNVAQTIYYGLFALQHRGQESCGIAVSRSDCPRGCVQSYKNMGLVNEVFNQEKIESLKGNIGIGHVRYASSGTAGPQNSQPLVLNYVQGMFSIANNGSLVNEAELKQDLEYTGAVFQTTTDSEIIAYHIARERTRTDSVEEAVEAALKKVKGAYALIVMTPSKLIGARDPYGLKPLCLGKRDSAYVLASESCALDSVNAEFIRDIEPGEIVTIKKDGELVSNKSNMLPMAKQGRCVFEYIYFARPDSRIDDVSVYMSRIQAGKFLAQDCPVEADIVIGVPESGNPAALGYAMGSGIPYGNGFIKNNYIGRTFIRPKQKDRESAVKIKLNVLKEAINGKRVVMVDDSIVRGTTSRRIVGILREAGAAEVHVRSCSPPFLYPCYFGTDVPSREQLIAYNRNVDEICRIIGADSLGYLSIDRLPGIVKDLPICTGCFNGKYPIVPEYHEEPEDNAD